MGVAILVVQTTVLQEKGKKKRLPGDAIQHIKEVEDPQGLYRNDSMPPRCSGHSVR